MGWTSKLSIAAICLSVLTGGMGSVARAGEDRDGLCPVYVKNVKKYGYVDGTGRWVVPPTLSDAEDFHEGLAYGSEGYIDKNGRKVISRYDGGPFHEGLATIISVDNGQIKRGYIDKTGREVISPQFAWAGDFSEGLAFVNRDGEFGHYGYIDKAGREIISPRYTIAFSFSDGLALVADTGNFGYIDKTGRVVIALGFEEAFSFSEGLAPVKRGGILALITNDGHYGYIDKTGREVIAPQFEQAFPFSGGLARVKRDGKSGYIDKTGRQVIAPQYNDADAFSGGLAKVRRYSHWGYIDKSGREVIPIRYAKASRCANGIFVVSDSDDGPTYLLDASGSRLTEFDRQEKARAEGQYKYPQVLDSRDPQKMYLAAGSYARNGDEGKAKHIYQTIIERFPDSDFAVKASDQLLAGKRAGDVQKARDDAAREQERMTDQINRDARNRAYSACREEMNACFTRTNGKGQCYRNCDSLR